MSMPPVIVAAPGDIVQGRPRAAARRPTVSRRLRHERTMQRREDRGPVNVSLWIPSTLIFALLAPFAMLLLPFLYLTPRQILESPAKTLAGVGAVLLSLGGTVIDVDCPDCRVHIRLF